MKITFIDIWKLSIPMHPFRIATGTMHYAQNIFIRVHTDDDITGNGECSAFPVITGETQNTCFEMARDFATLWKNKDPLQIAERLAELDAFTAFNGTIKSAFDMALFDIAAKHAGEPLYKFLGGTKTPMETDLTIGIDEPAKMAEKAKDFVARGVGIIKVKLGTSATDDIARITQIRKAAGDQAIIRIDANQGWSFDDAIKVLTAIAPYNVQFCEQPMRTWDDHKMSALREQSPIPIMADESVFDHHDAQRIISSRACDYVNIKFAKSGGIAEADRINDVCAKNNVACMMGGMLESRMALTAFAHFAAARPNIRFYDMDTCMLGHTIDPVTGGVRFNGYVVELPDGPGIGADIESGFLQTCERLTI